MTASVRKGPKLNVDDPEACLYRAMARYRKKYGSPANNSPFEIFQRAYMAGWNDCHRSYLGICRRLMRGGGV